MFLRECWYVVAQSSEIRHSLTALEILGEKIVFYRKENGDPVALEDACPHRKLPLSMGNLKADVLECGYHGLTFDCTGACVAAPTQDRISAQTKVRRYALTERYELLWIWMGNFEDADESKIIEVDDYEDPTWGLTDGGMLQCDCHYLWLIDNLLDPSHVAWVHKTSFASKGTEDTPLTIQQTDTGVLVSRWILDIEPPPYYANMVKFAGQADRLQHYQAIFPSIAVNKSIYTPAGSGGQDRVLPKEAYLMRSYHFLTPINEQSTRYHWFQHFNTDGHDAAVKEKLNQGARGAFEEDKVVLEAVHLGMQNKTTRNIDLQLDIGARKFRRGLDALIAKEASE
jgi:phenylpropionate dioxygenase-like ring-hydroxylating dioxygenase large terminal subunit